MAERDNPKRAAEVERFVGALPVLPGKMVDQRGFSLLNTLEGLRRLSYEVSREDPEQLDQLRGIVRSGNNPHLAKELAKTTLDIEDIGIYAEVARRVKDPKKRGDHLVEVGDLIRTRRRMETDPPKFRRAIRDNLEVIEPWKPFTDSVRTDDQLFPDLRAIVTHLSDDERPEDALTIAKGLQQISGEQEDLTRVVECIFDLDNPREVISELLKLPFDPEVNMVVFRILREGGFVAPGRSHYWGGRESEFSRNDIKLPDPEVLSEMPDQERLVALDENLRGIMAQTLIEHFVFTPIFHKHGIDEMLDQLLSYPFPLEDGLKRLDFAKNAIPWIIKMKYDREIDPNMKDDKKLLERYRCAALHLADQATDEDQRARLNEEARWMTDNPDYLGAEQLLDHITQAGPGESLKVRVNDPETGETYVGTTTWVYEAMEELGPAVLRWKDPRKQQFWVSMLPLGGSTIYKFPHFRDGLSRQIMDGNIHGRKRMPISAGARKKQFELLDPKDGLTREEMDDIASLGEEATVGV